MVENYDVNRAWFEDGSRATEAPELFILVTLLLLSALIAAAVLVAVTRRRRNVVDEVHEPEKPGSEPPDRTVGVRLIALQLADRAVILDGVVNDTANPLGPVGMPISIRVKRPDTAALDDVMRSLLTTWVANDEVVRCTVGGAEPRRNVAIARGESVLRLGLEPFDGRRSTPSGL